MVEIDFSNKNVDFSKPRMSISNILDSLETPFDSLGVATKTHDNHFNDPESEYYQMSVEEIMAKWAAKGKQSTDYGSLLDNYIGEVLTGTPRSLQLYKLDNDLENDERLQSLVSSFDNFYSLVQKSGDMEFVAREKSVYYTITVDNPMFDFTQPESETNKKEIEYVIKGRFDALFRNKRTGKWVVIDWKSSGEVEKVTSPWTKNLKGPAKIYPQLNWYRYTTQLYFYKKTLIESGYLPAGTTYDDVEVMIVQLPGHICEGGQNYMIHRGAFPFDTTYMDKVYKFAVQKKILGA